MDTCAGVSGTGVNFARQRGADVDGTLDIGLSSALTRLPLPPATEGVMPGTGTQWFRQRIGDLRGNPGFGAAAMHVARSAVQLFEGRYLVNKAMANVSRQTVGMAILSSYFGQAEKTGTFLSSIQTLTTAMGVCSKNTAAANVALLDRLGLVVRVENPKDRRWMYIQPTEELISAARDYHRIFLTAADALFPPGNYRALYDRDQSVQERSFSVGLYSYIALHTSVFNFEHSRVFMGTDGGTILLFKLMSLEGPGWQAGNSTVEFPYEEIGASFGLSRTHVRRLMNNAEAAGFVRLLQKGGRQVRILPSLVDLFENIVAASVVRAQLDTQLAIAEDLPIPAR